MKKTFKRIIALAIVLCTLGAMMIPGVSVANAAAPASKTFDIKADTVAAGVTYGSGNRFWSDGTCRTNLDNYYATSGWTVYKNDSGAILNTGYPPRFYKNGLQFYPNALSTYAYSVMKIVAPGTGDYTLSLKPSVISSADERAEIAGAYIIPYGNYDKSTLPGVNSEAAAAGSKVTLNETTLSEQVFHAGEGTVSLVEGQEYLLVFYYYDTTSKTAKADFQAFSLTGVAKYDYSVTYHANYDGAAVETVADDENVTGSTAAETEITLNAPFVRPGYTFKGWATTPDGAVAYKAGDKLTLTAEATTADLYAIWGDGNLSVNFASVGGNNLIHWDVPNETMIGISNNFIANGWKFYTVEGGAYNVGASYLRRNSNGYGNHMIATNATGGLHLQYHTKYTTDSYIPVEFEAPGTGEYKLSFTASRVHRISQGGAYIVKIPEGGFASIDDLPKQDSAQVLTLLNTQTAQSNNDTMLPYEDTNTIYLESGSRYAIVFFAVAAEGYTEGYLRFRDFSLTKVAPAASIAGKYEGSLAGAIAASTAGDTIKLMQDVTADEVSLLAGVTLNLNGKTLTTGAIAGTVIDSADGAGLIAIEKEAAAISAGAGQIALWDNNQNGYRVFTYDFKTYESVAGNDNVEGVSEFIDFYDYERQFLAKSFDEYGEVAKGAGDFKFNQVLDNGNTVIQQIAADYDAGNTSWRYEYSNQQYQMGRGGLCFSWGAKSIRQFGAGFMAVRMEAPADGKVTVKLDTSFAEDPADNAGFDMYIVKASEIEALCADYAANYAAFAAAPATAVEETKAAFDTAMANNTKVITGVSDGNVYTGTYTFEEGVEYIFIFNNNGSIKGALHMNFQNISFQRAEKKGAVQTFWSDLEFTNDAAYQYLPTAGLQVGFKMSTLENPAAAEDFKLYQLDDATVAAWADAESVNKDDTNWGFYIRVSGFEALTEDTTVTCVPYININNETITADPVIYNYVVAE